MEMGNISNNMKTGKTFYKWKQITKQNKGEITHGYSTDIMIENSIRNIAYLCRKIHIQNYYFGRIIT